MMPPILTPPGARLVGQPFSISRVSLPVTMTLHCNCSATPTTIEIVNSAAATCPTCQIEYTATFNPLVGKLDIQAVRPAKDEVPS